MDHPIILMRECVVKLSTPEKSGTGFFVAPGKILTCAHVVGDLTTRKFCENEIQVRWKKHDNFAVTRVIPEKWQSDLDIILLEYSSKHSETPPCVLLGRVCNTNNDSAIPKMLITANLPHLTVQDILMMIRHIEGVAFRLLTKLP